MEVDDVEVKPNELTEMDVKSTDLNTIELKSSSGDSTTFFVEMDQDQARVFEDSHQNGSPQVSFCEAGEGVEISQTDSLNHGNEVVVVVKTSETGQSDDVEYILTDASQTAPMIMNIVDSTESKKSFQCTVCNYKSARKDTLINHINAVHQRIKSFKCDFCEFSTARRGTLKRHLRMVHKQSSTELVCPLCGYRTTNDKNLANHVKESHKPAPTLPAPQEITEQQYILMEDGSLVKLDSDNTQITFMKFDEKPKRQKNSRRRKEENASEVQCQICNHRAVNRYKLKAHIKFVHEKDKPFECSSCSFRTVTQNKLQSHIQEVHERQKPFTCPLCDFKSARQFNLNVHVRQVHNREKPFSCSLCNFSAPRRDRVRKHLFVNHGKTAAESRDLILTKFQDLKSDSVSNSGPAPVVTFASAQPLTVPSTNELPSFISLPKHPVLPSNLGLATKTKNDESPAKQTNQNADIWMDSNNSPPAFILGFGQEGPPVQMTVDITSQDDEQNPEAVVLDSNFIDINKLTGKATEKRNRRVSKMAPDYESRMHRCHMCDYRAGRSNTLKMHIIAVHERNKSFQCDLCSYKTARKGDLNRHVRNVHK